MIKPGNLPQGNGSKVEEQILFATLLVFSSIYWYTVILQFLFFFTLIGLVSLITEFGFSMKIQNLFKKSYEKLDEVESKIYSKKIGFVYEITKRELYEMVEKADSGIDKAKSDLDIRLEHDAESEEKFFFEFMDLYHKYYEKSRRLRNLISTRAKYISFTPEKGKLACIN